MRLSRIPAWALAAMLLAVLVPAATHRARAEPYLALDTGLKCSQCHVNRTGGGQRTAFGAAFAATNLASAPATDGGATAQPGRLSGHFAFGGNFRGALTHTRVPGQPRTTAFEQQRTLLYLQAALVPGELTFYADQQVAPGTAYTREGFALLEGLPGDGYVKAGKFFLPYGWRLQDDSAFVRRAAQVNYNTPDVGVEIGAEPGPWRLHLALTNGTQAAPEDNAQKMVSTLVAFVQRGWRVGASALRNRAGDESLRTAGNVFAGVHLGPFNVLGELDRVRDESPTGTLREQQAALAEVNAWLGRGVNLKLTYEHLDPDRAVAEDGRVRYSAVLEPFLRRFVQLRAGVRIAEGIPQAPQQNTDTAFVELHVYF